MSNESQMARKRHEVLADMVAHCERIMVDNSVPPEVASVIANAIADHFAEHWGGQLISFPMDYRWELDQRYLAIHDRSRAGASNSELAMLFKISDRHVRTILSIVRKRIAEQARRAPPGQADIFEPEPAQATPPALNMSRIYRALKLAIFDLVRETQVDGTDADQGQTLIVLVDRATGQTKALQSDASLSELKAAIEAAQPA